MPATKRAVYSIRSDILDRFNAAYQGRERSKMIERMMLRVLDAEENEIAAAAAQIESDPELASYRETSDWADANAVDTFSRF
ncbi:hypothetical protein V3H18_15925 [Methylocystis sp. 9N]|uniref:CopG family transcriptional regulator n=1 Tax=Methylocystis borbori TaxID=3118750 RepID=A0ABU7XKW9_9HYPH